MATRVIVSGRVQGVGFRWSAAQQAQKLGARGTIANRADGTVEAVVDDGPGAAELIAWLHGGPQLAQVTGVETAEVPDTGSDGFRVL